MIKMIAVENITFGYKRSKRFQFENFSLSIEKGKVYGLLGKNGAGKSTLLYLISGLLSAMKGEIIYKGSNVAKRLPQTLSDIYIVPEEFELPPITLTKYIDCNKAFYPNFSMSDLEKYLGCFDMNIDVHLGSLSMGQKKKVYMSFALATNTSLILMDEPTNGLDIPGKSQFRKLVSLGMNDNKTIIISTHQVKDVDKLLDHVVVMNTNNVILDESVASVCDKLKFIETVGTKPVDGALYVTPSINGNCAIVENTDGSESPINLELLFNALLSDEERITKIFHN